jgi:hypothetical protein
MLVCAGEPDPLARADAKAKASETVLIFRKLTFTIFNVLLAVDWIVSGGHTPSLSELIGAFLPSGPYTGTSVDNKSYGDDRLERLNQSPPPK